MHAYTSRHCIRSACRSLSPLSNGFLTALPWLVRPAGMRFEIFCRPHRRFSLFRCACYPIVVVALSLLLLLLAGIPFVHRIAFNLRLCRLQTAVYASARHWSTSPSEGARIPVSKTGPASYPPTTIYRRSFVRSLARSFVCLFVCLFVFPIVCLFVGRD